MRSLNCVVVGGRSSFSIDVDPEERPSNASNAEPIQKDVPFEGPVDEESFSVPMESIDAYVQVSGLFLSADKVRPLCLLYGPRQFGKTTISYRLWNLLASDPSVLAIYHSATTLSVQTEAHFWSALIRLCCEDGSTSQDLLHILLRRKQRLLLIIDEMDEMFVNTVLTRSFMNVLCEWQAAPYFCGFLGIGSYKLVSLCEQHKRSDRSNPFNLCTLFPVQRFSRDQMAAFFKLIEPTYAFKESTRGGIIDFSGGAPGVFGSLIRLSVDHCKWRLERHEWDEWLNAETSHIT
ncbi:hypothetical protein LEN26_000138 [Aphanomyces euteiches]|nr:hypothetical protein AeMF1_002371 [Aphanomyces euteiches]KAH9164241.1 hypothetical protein LEN26_000138 [Aphanomyces euteiches]KAH9192719.1 hypothetical protein AeNC1_005311 [Aphanomyces euteiches]